MTFQEVLAKMTKQLIQFSNKKSHPVCVAINGIDGTGKTYFAEHLFRQLKTEGVEVYHVSIDGFHNVREVRYRQGRDSARGYYEDSYNERAFVNQVLKPVHTPPFQFTPAIHDLETDELLSPAAIRISSNAILLTDGSHLFKSVYREFCDLKVYLKTTFEIAKLRGTKRDSKMLGGLDKASQLYDQRYHAASRIYRAENDPESLADVILDNSDLKDWVWVKPKD